MKKVKTENIFFVGEGVGNIKIPEELDEDYLKKFEAIREETLRNFSKGEILFVDEKGDAKPFEELSLETQRAIKLNYRTNIDPVMDDLSRTIQNKVKESHEALKKKK